MVLPEMEKGRSGEADVAGIASTREGTGKPLLETARNDPTIVAQGGPS